MADEPPGARSAVVGRLYDTYGDRMYRYALMLTGDRAGAADVVHDVFRVLFETATEIDAPLAYLRRAVRNRVISLARHRQVRSHVPLDEALLEPASESAVSVVDRLTLERAVRTLSWEQREVVHLHVFEGLTLQETAEIVEVSSNTVAARYRYALRHLRRMLDPDEPLA